VEKKKLTSNSGEELRKLSYEIRYLEQTAETIESRMNVINAILRDLTYANMTLETLEKEKGNSEILVPIGSSSYIRAKLEDTSRIIVGIGAGVSVEKTLPETKDVVKKRLEDLEKTRNSLVQQFEQVAQKIGEDRERFEHLAAELREGKALEDV
jgi:prefoldin alpha subunit